MGGIEYLVLEGYGYVVLTLVLYCFFNFWMAFQVGKARKKYNVFYPTTLCLRIRQQGCQALQLRPEGTRNSLELMPIFFMLMNLGGIKHPFICTSLGLLYIVGRYFYFTGYATCNPQNRLSLGKLGFLALLGLMITTISCGIKLIVSHE